MENVTKGTLIALSVLIKLAVVSTHLHFLGNYVAALSFCSSDIIFESPTAAKIRNLRLWHTLAFLWDEHFKCSQIPILLQLLLSLFLLSLYSALDCFYIALKPPFRLELTHLFLTHDLLPLWLDLSLYIVLQASRREASILLISVLQVGSDWFIWVIWVTAVRVRSDRVNCDWLWFVKGKQVTILTEAYQLGEIEDIAYCRLS